MPRIGRQEAPPAAQEVLRAGLLSGYSVDNEGTVAVHSPYSRGPLAATMKAGPGRARVHRENDLLGRASAEGPTHSSALAMAVARLPRPTSKGSLSLPVSLSSS